MFVIQNFQISFVNTWSRPAPGRARAKTVVGQRAVNAKESSVAQYNFALISAQITAPTPSTRLLLGGVVVRTSRLTDRFGHRR